MEELNKIKIKQAVEIKKGKSYVIVVDNTNANNELDIIRKKLIEKYDLKDVTIVKASGKFDLYEVVE